MVGMPLASDVGGFNFGRNAVAGFKTLCRWRYINPRRAGTRSSVVPGVDISLLAAYTLATLLTFIHCSLYIFVWILLKGVTAGRH